MVEAPEIHAVLHDAFPIRSKDRSFELQFVADVPFESHDDVLVATFRTVSWETRADGQPWIRDIKEQPCPLGGPAELADPSRLANYLAALARILETSELAEPDYLVPADLLPRALDLPSARTPEDFDKALRSKKRLGQHLRNG